MSEFEESATTTQFGVDIFYHFAAKYPNARFYWIIGEDQLDQLAYWKEIDAYAGRLEWIVAPRATPRMMAGLLSRRLLHSSVTYHWLKLGSVYKPSSTALREALSRGPRLSAEFLTWIPKSIKHDVLKTYQQWRNSPK